MPTARKSSARPSMGMFIVLHGVPNVGKTSMAASAEKPYVIYDSMERGIVRLIDAGEVSLDPKYVQPASSWENLLNRIDNFPDDRQTLVLDAATGIQQLCYEHVARQDFAGKMNAKGFFNYQKGPKRVASNEWPRDLLSRLVDLTNAGKDVILIAHSRPKIMSNPAGEDYERFYPYMDSDVWMATVKDAQYVLFLGYLVETEGRKAKESTSQRIFIGTNPAYETKSLPKVLAPSIPMGRSGKDAWKNFLECIGRK